VNSSRISALYSEHTRFIILSGRYFSIIGLRPSEPGDFLLWNPLKASFIFCGVTQSESQSSMSFLLSASKEYFVGCRSVAVGKCWDSRYSRVSAPGLVIVPSSFSSVPSVCLVLRSIIFLNVLALCSQPMIAVLPFCSAFCILCVFPYICQCSFWMGILGIFCVAYIVLSFLLVVRQSTRGYPPGVISVYYFGFSFRNMSCHCIIYFFV